MFSFLVDKPPDRSCTIGWLDNTNNVVPEPKRRRARLRYVAWVGWRGTRDLLTVECVLSSAASG